MTRSTRNSKSHQLIRKNEKQAHTTKYLLQSNLELEKLKMLRRLDSSQNELGSNPKVTGVSLVISGKN